MCIKPENTCTIPDLRNRMIEKQATSFELSLASGVSKSMIDLVISGSSISKNLAEVLFITLETRPFQYKKRGRKSNKENYR